MKHRLAALLLSVASLAWSVSPAWATKFDIDPVHSGIAFYIDHLGFSKVIGVAQEFSGVFEFDATKPEGSSLDVKVMVGSISTNNKQRDGDIQGADWFNATEFPEITFVGKEFKKTSDTTGQIVGDLTIAGVTKSAALDVKFNKEGQNPWDKSHVVGFSATTKVKRSDFGMKAALGMIGDEVDLVIQVEGREHQS
ncbi:Polyisoprenoid-binding protein YceI [Rhizobium mongolense subsp. loessense]|uniref:Polyisoprenoid-binding protein YceI n=1 Tax=Rhizobium mongolense subsp. loessense TaxID=158890 RepID=A0A1G4R2M7_9HYPH|nr:YceI family protein [Rhizobium mongolense]SCW51106.1 Polyisoprenoid-binding protein YceI [Rhizobium mongolense subsp. loessense]